MRVPATMSKACTRRAREARIGQLLSHSAGFVRDGLDSGYFLDRRPFFNERELLADLANLPPSIEAGTRFKYSNHGYGLLGQVIASVTGEPYNDWIKREIVDAVGLTETAPDMPIDRAAPLASGHTGEYPFGRRAVIPGRMLAHAHVVGDRLRLARRPISPASSISCRRRRSEASCRQRAGAR